MQHRGTHAEEIILPLKWRKKQSPGCLKTVAPPRFSRGSTNPKTPSGFLARRICSSLRPAETQCFDAQRCPSEFRGGRERVVTQTAGARALTPDYFRVRQNNVSVTLIRDEVKSVSLFLQCVIRVLRHSFTWLWKKCDFLFYYTNTCVAYVVKTQCRACSVLLQLTRDHCLGPFVTFIQRIILRATRTILTVIF